MTPERSNSEIDKPTRSFMVSGDVMGICIVLALKMTKTGKGEFIVKAFEDNNIDTATGKLYPEGKARMLMEGQDDFSAYDRALARVLEAREAYLVRFGDEFIAGLKVSEEIDDQVDYFRLGLDL